MQVVDTPISPFLQNAPIIFCEETKEAIFVDPGDDLHKLKSVIDELKLLPQYIVLTHGHIDHAGATKALSEDLGLDIIGPHAEDQFLLDALELQGQMYGITAQNFLPHKWLNHGEILNVGNLEIEVRHCPGHTPGHIILINHKHKFVVAGDVIFKNSVGRSDLPRGNHNDLISSIDKHIMSLPDDYVIHSGHGPTTTVGFERKTNPFLQ